ncbi:MAG: hypothetical protein BGN86_06130 [Caulobacterales bacterium 68-7]|nr:MAG: hypothetical protein BGN86_06130 [Caulobacterales bacterium 68-7]
MTFQKTAKTVTAPRTKGWTLVASQILPVMAIVTLFPVIPKLFQQFGAIPNAALLVPMIVTIPSIFAALFAPLAGVLADRYGRRPVFLTAVAVYAVAGGAPLLLSDLAQIIVSRAILGIAEGAIVAISSALIADYFGDQRYRWVSWVGISTSLAGTVLIAAGGILADVSWRAPFGVYLAAFPLFLVSFFVLDEPERSAVALKSAPSRFPWKAAFAIGAVTLITSLLYYVEPLNIATIFSDLGAGSSTRIGLVQALTSLGYILGAFVYRKIHARTLGQLLCLAGLLIGIGNAVIALGRTELVVSLGATIQQMGGGMVIPIPLAWGRGLLPLEQRSRGMGIWATAFFAGTFLCPPMIAAVSAATGGLKPAILALAVVTIALSLAAPFLGGRSASTSVH